MSRKQMAGLATVAVTVLVGAGLLLAVSDSSRNDDQFEATGDRSFYIGSVED